MAQPKTKQARVKKKIWLPIFAPKSFNNMMLGETFVQEADRAVGKSITQSLMILADDPRKQGYSIRFDVTSVKEGKAQTQVLGMSMTPSAIKRLIRRNRDKISDSFVTKIAGGRLVRVKPVLVTRTLVSKAVQTSIRMTARKFLKEQYAKMRFDDIVHDIIDMKVQKQLKDLCGKIHPVRTADIKEIIVLPETRSMTKEMEEMIEAEAAAEEKKREQLKSAAAVAAVEEEPAAKSAKKKATKKKDE